MLRYLKYAFMAVLAILLVTTALANRAPVTLHLLPGELSGFLGFSWQISLPLFIVIFGGIIAGLIIGFIWEWLREYSMRAEGKRARRAAVNLAREVQTLKGPNEKAGDDIIALLDRKA